MIDPTQLQLIKQLIEIESTADKPENLTRALQLVEELVLLKAPGVHIEHFEKDGKPSFLAYMGATRPERFRVLLNGHVDVVPGKPEQFKPYEKDGKLFGRGTQDMKIAALILAEAFCTFAGKTDYSLGLQIVADEEIGGAAGTGYQVQQGVAADFVIAGEFTPHAAICTEMRGICQCSVTFRGRAAHAAYLWNGSNALLQANDFVAKLLQQYPMPASDSWVTTANVAAISTPNTTFNRVPDEATVLFDIRYIPGDKHFATKVAAQAFLQSLDKTAQVTINMFEPSHQASSADPMVKQLAAAVTQATGQPVTFIKKHGGADVRFYSERGAQAVTFGLQGDGLHGDDEYVELARIPTYQQALEIFLRDLKT